MEEVFKKLLEEIKTDRNKLQAFKKMAVNTQSYELASNIRSIEVQHFPDQALPDNEYDELNLLKAAFGLVGVKIDVRMAWMIKQVTDQFHDIGEKFDLKAASKIQSDCEIYFWKEITS